VADEVAPEVAYSGYVHPSRRDRVLTWTESPASISLSNTFSKQVILSRTDTEFQQIRRYCKLLGWEQSASVTTAMAMLLNSVDLSCKSNMLAVLYVGGIDNLIQILHTCSESMQSGSLEILNLVCHCSEVARPVAKINTIKLLLSFYAGPEEDPRTRAARDLLPLLADVTDDETRILVIQSGAATVVERHISSYLRRYDRASAQDQQRLNHQASTALALLARLTSTDACRRWFYARDSHLLENALRITTAVLSNSQIHCYTNLNSEHVPESGISNLPLGADQKSKSDDRNGLERIDTLLGTDNRLNVHYKNAVHFSEVAMSESPQNDQNSTDNPGYRVGVKLCQAVLELCVELTKRRCFTKLLGSRGVLRLISSRIPCLDENIMRLACRALHNACRLADTKPFTSCVLDTTECERLFEFGVHSTVVAFSNAQHSTPTPNQTMPAAIDEHHALHLARLGDVLQLLGGLALTFPNNTEAQSPSPPLYSSSITTLIRAVAIVTEQVSSCRQSFELYGDTSGDLKNQEYVAMRLIDLASIVADAEVANAPRRSSSAPLLASIAQDSRILSAHMSPILRSTFSDLVLASTHFLWSVCRISCHFQSELGRSDVVVPLTDLLHHASDAVRTNSTALLCSLLSEPDCVCLLATNLSSCISSLGEGLIGDHDNVVANICGCVSKLLGNSAARSIILEEGFVDLIPVVSSATHPYIQEAFSYVVAVYAFNDSASCRGLREAGCITRLISNLQSSSVEVIRATVSALRQLCKERASSRLILVDGAIPHLLKILCEASGSLQEEAAGCLQTIREWNIVI